MSGRRQLTTAVLGFAAIGCGYGLPQQKRPETAPSVEASILPQAVDRYKRIASLLNGQDLACNGRSSGLLGAVHVGTEILGSDTCVTYRTNDGSESL